MVVNNSSFAFLTYKFLSTAGVPLIGGGYDGTYYGEPGNENIISASGNVVAGQRRHLRHTAEDHEADGRQEGRRARLRHLARRRRGGEEPPEVRGSRGRPRRPSTPTPPSTSAAPTSARRCSASRTPAPTPCTSRWSPAPTSRSCRGSSRTASKMKSQRAGHRLRPAAARPAGRETARARGRDAARSSRRSSSRPRPPSSSRPTSRSTPTSPACPTSASTPATSTATWPSGAQGAGKNLDPSTYADGLRKLGKVRPGRARLPAHRHQRRDLRQGRADDLQLGADRQGRQVRGPLAQGAVAIPSGPGSSSARRSARPPRRRPRPSRNRALAPNPGFSRRYRLARRARPTKNGLGQGGDATDGVGLRDRTGVREKLEWIRQFVADRWSRST